MNMIVHGHPTALIVQGNTVADPKFKDADALKTFDYVVANPPFSDRRWSTGVDPLHDLYERFQPFGTPPAKLAGVRDGLQPSYSFLSFYAASGRSLSVATLRSQCG